MRRPQSDMAKHTFKVTVFVGQEKVRRWSPDLQVDDIQVDKAGSLWGEKQILHLGAHLDVYTHYRRGTTRGRWRSGGTVSASTAGTLRTTSTLPPSYDPALGKLPGSSVSGNFGEVITILALEAKKRRRRALQICHLCPRQGLTNLKCPDLLLESAPLQPDYELFKLKRLHGLCSICGLASCASPVSPVLLPPLPLFMPGECKNTNFLGALRQLVTYWQEAKQGSPVYGYGLISTIRYQRPPELKLHLMVPENAAALDTLLSGITSVDDLHQANFRGILYGF